MNISNISKNKVFKGLSQIFSYCLCLFCVAAIYPVMTFAQTEIRESSQYWGQGNAFGSAVSTSSNNELYIGTPFGDVGFLEGTSNYIDSGAVSVYSDDGTYLRTITLPPNSTPMSYDQFGASLSNTKFNNTELLLIGAPGRSRGNSSSAGAAYLFAAGNGTLVESFSRPGSFSQDDRFGHAIDSDGQFYLIGAPGVKKHPGIEPDSGAVYLFERVVGATNYIEMINPDPINTSPGDRFGWSVAFLSQGKIAIGAPGDNEKNVSAGAVWIYSNPDDQNPRKILPGNHTVKFGSSLAALGKDLLIVGAPNETTYNLFTRERIEESGAVYIINHQTGVVVSKIENPDQKAYGHFGTSIRTQGDYLIIGAPGMFSGLQGGSVYLYSVSKKKLLVRYDGPKPKDTTYPGLFGESVALFGTSSVVSFLQNTKLLVGAPLIKGVHERQGAAYIYQYCDKLCPSSQSIEDGYDDTIIESLDAELIRDSD